jgi:hypothetical protein
MLLSYLRSLLGANYYSSTSNIYSPIEFFRDFFGAIRATLTLSLADRSLGVAASDESFSFSFSHFDSNEDTI